MSMDPMADGRTASTAIVLLVITFESISTAGGDASPVSECVINRAASVSVKRTNSQRCKEWYVANRERKLAYEARRRVITAERQAARKRWLYNNDPEHHDYKLAQVKAHYRANRDAINKRNRERRNIDCIVAKMIADTKDDPLLKKNSEIRFVYGKTRKREL